MPLGEGTVLGGRYRLLSRVGRGGMGVVWHAHDDILDRDVAIKEVLFPPGLGETEHRVLYERTLREARSAARLNHRGIVTVHDVVEEDGRPCIVMELVRARSLQDVIDDEGPLDPIPTAEIGLQVLAALRAAHAAGITHRDVKPANVLLATRSSDERISAATRVVITDFGIATMEGDATLTQTGLVMGSPAYISPERAQGDRATPASDLWSLGATLYAACEGRAPYHRTEAMAAITAIMSEEAPPPRHAGPLTPVLMGLLVKDPERRMTADEAADGLRRAAQSTRPLPSPSRQAAGDVPAPGHPGDPGEAGGPPGRDAYGAGPEAYDPPERTRAPAGAGRRDPGEPAARAYDAGGPGPYERAAPGYGPDEHGAPATGASGPSVPATGPAAPGGARRRGPRRALAAGLMALVVAGVAVAVLFTHPWSGSGHATDGSPTSAPPSPSSSPPPAPVPAGYRMAPGPYGSRIAVPRGWVRRAKPGSVLWYDPATGAQLQVDCTGWGTTDPHAHWLRFARKAAAGPNLPGFHTIGGSPATFRYRGWPAADLEWMWRQTRGPMHGYDRGVWANGRPYALFVAAPQRDWARYQPVLDSVFATFQPGSS